MTEMDDYALEMLVKLRLEGTYPARNPEQALARRELYIKQVSSLVRSKSQQNQIIPHPLLLRMEWMKKLAPAWPRMRFSWMGSLAAIVIVIAILFTGAGIAVAAAQTSGPLDTLYPLKLASEDFRLSLTANPLYQFDLLLEFTDRRVDEIVDLQRSGEQIPDHVAARLLEHSHQLFQLAAGFDDQSLVRALNRLQLRLSLQEQKMFLALQGESKAPGQVYLRLQDMLNTQVNLVALGLRNPKAFRQQVRQGDARPVILRTDTATKTPEAGYGPAGDNAATPCQKCTPAPGGFQASPSSEDRGTNTPQGGYRQGPGVSGTPDCEQCSPQPKHEQQGPQGTPESGPSGSNYGKPGGMSHP